MAPVSESRQTLALCLASAAFALTFCALSAWQAMPFWESAFKSDGSPTSWLSSAQLLLIAGLALRLGLDRSLPRGLAAWLTVAIFILALDEQFMFHEQWKFGCRAYFPPCRSAALGKVVRELPMLLVGIVGVGTALRLARVLPTRVQRSCLWVAIGIGIGAVAIDQIGLPPEIAVFEEGVEVLSEAVFLGVLLGLRPDQRGRQSSAGDSGQQS